MTKVFPKKNCGFILLIACMAIIAIPGFRMACKKTGTLKITFINTANGKIISLDDSLYINAFQEQYTISKLKYYISNTNVGAAKQLQEIDPYHLINAREENNSFELVL